MCVLFTHGEGCKSRILHEYGGGTRERKVVYLEPVLSFKTGTSLVIGYSVVSVYIVSPRLVFDPPSPRII